MEIDASSNFTDTGHRTNENWGVDNSCLKMIFNNVFLHPTRLPRFPQDPLFRWLAQWPELLKKALKCQTVSSSWQAFYIGLTHTNPTIGVYIFYLVDGPDGSVCTVYQISKELRIAIQRKGRMPSNK